MMHHQEFDMLKVNVRDIIVYRIYKKSQDIMDCSAEKIVQKFSRICSF